MLRSAAISIAACGALLAAPASARADEGSSDYCDYVKGVAASEGALLWAPELFTSFGYVDQLSVVDSPGGTGDDLRFTLGVSYSVGDLYESRLVKKRADAACKRRRALDALGGETTHRAMAARAEVLDQAAGEAGEMLDRAQRDFDRRRATRQELIATRVKVERVRELAAQARRQLDALPAPKSPRPMARALAAYDAADRDFERQEGALRRARAWDVSVRLGYDKFLGNDDSSPLFAVVSAQFNVGWFLQGGANERAARARRTMRDDDGQSGALATAARLRSLLAIDSRRAQETGALVADLEKQLDALKGLGGENSRRLYETVWFEWVEAKADHAYLTAHVESLRVILGKRKEAPE